MDNLAKGSSARSPAKPALPAQRAQQERGVPRHHPIPRREAPGPAPLSFAQQRLWFLEQLEPHQPTYNLPGAYRLRGHLDVPTLQDSLAEIVRRHEPLRTVFTYHDGDPRQVIRSPEAFPLPVLDLGHLPETERDAVATQMAAEEVQRPFELSADLMLRAKLLRLAEADHLLVITMHHIASDGWSRGVFWRELTALYQAKLTGQPSPLPALPIQYADYAVWQRAWLQGEVLERHLAYWRRQLANLMPLELPTDRPRLAVQSHRGAHRARTMPRPLLDGLEALSRQAGTTLFMTLLTAFQTLLHRYTGQTDLALGAPIAGRTHMETEGLIGFFVNTLVLRTDLAGNPTFRELLGRVRQIALDAYDHQDLPFEKLVEELNPERNLSQSPLFQVMFAFQNFPRVALSLPGLTVTPLRVESGTAKFDLTLFVTATDSGLETGLDFNTDLFDASTIARMLGHFQILLEAIVSHPDTRIAALPLLTAAERHQLLVEWSATHAEYPANACVHHLFEAQVERTPDAMAVLFEDQQLTYHDLNQRANRLAHFLQRLGIGPDVPVGICVERSVDMVVGLLGILKAGGAYVPLDPGYPQDRLAFMLADSQAPVLVTQARLAARHSAPRARVVCLDADEAALAQESPANPTSEVTAENLAYVIYTSGSTGQPKGVAMPHRSLVNLISWQVSCPTLPTGARTLQFVSLSFDVSFQEIFTTWCSAGTLVLIRDSIQRDPRQLLRLLAGVRVDRAFLPPRALQMLAEELAGSSFPVLALREVIAAGEELQVTPEVVSLFKQLNNATLHNHYGPTETHVVTQFRLEGCPESWPALPPIGRPIANIQVYVLDPALQLVPVGVPGDLYVGGAALARGYLNRPDLTAERFIPHPFSTRPGARLYRTGDRVRWRPDGVLEFLGRHDSQVKIRGFRVELGEVEAVLSHHLEVQSAVVVAHEVPPHPKHLVAYVMPAPGPGLTSSELRRFLGQKLPEYMVPTAYRLLEALPLTPSGKLDRQALSALGPDRPKLETPYEAPRTPVEIALGRIWADLLGVDRIGVHDNFFDLGGHSLIATQLMSRVRDTFQMDVALRTLFEAPTVAGLAAAIVESLERCPERQEQGRILAALEQLSDEEAQRFLTRGMQQGGVERHG